MVRLLHLRQPRLDPRGQVLRKERPGRGVPEHGRDLLGRLPHPAAGAFLFGWLSDKIGRKPIILAGFFLAAVTYYPLYAALGSAANPANINYPLSILIVAIMVSYVGMVYGPIGAFLAEYFPARIRYSSVSVPYHIGNG